MSQNHTKAAERELQQHLEAIESNKQEQQRLQEELTETEPKYDRAVADGDEDAIEQLEKETWTKQNRLKALQRNLQRLEDETADYEASVEAAKKQDRKIELQQQASEYNAAGKTLNALIADNLQAFKTAAEYGNIVDQIRRFDPQANLFKDYGLEVTAPGAHTKKRTLKGVIEYLASGGENKLFTATDAFEQADKEAA